MRGYVPREAYLDVQRVLQRRLNEDSIAYAGQRRRDSQGAIDEAVAVVMDDWLCSILAAHRPDSPTGECAHTETALPGECAHAREAVVGTTDQPAALRRARSVAPDAGHARAHANP
jgi:hypothetical protein